MCIRGNKCVAYLKQKQQFSSQFISRIKCENKSINMAMATIAPCLAAIDG